MREIHQVAAVRSEKPMAIEALFELGQRHRREITVGIGLQICVIVTRHDETNGIDGDKDLLAAFLYRDALRLARLHMQRDIFARAVHGLLQAIDFNRLHQIVDGIDFEAIEGMLAIRGNENNRRRVLQTLKSFGELEARHFRHAHIEEQNVNGVALHLLDSFANARGLCKHFDATNFAQQIAQFGTSRSLVVNDYRVQHGIPQ